MVSEYLGSGITKYHLSDGQVLEISADDMEDLMINNPVHKEKISEMRDKIEDIKDEKRGADDDISDLKSEVEDSEEKNNTLLNTIFEKDVKIAKLEDIVKKLTKV